MNLRTPVVVSALLILLSACGSGPPRKIHPSTASIQQLTVQADGSWSLKLRVQNYSTFPMRYSALNAKLSIDGVEVGEVRATTDMEIVANNGDVIDASVRSSSKLPADRDFAYQIKGTIETSEPKESFEFNRSSRLSPVPGVPNTYR
jgi:hypothetical protein